MGGWLSIAAGGLIGAAAALNPNPYEWGMAETAGLLVGFGALFLYVSVGARRDRLRLLDSPQRPT